MTARQSARGPHVQPEEAEKTPPSVPIKTAPRRRTPEQRERDAECRRQRRAKEECKEAELEEQRAMYQIKYVSKACDPISASATVLLDAHTIKEYPQRTRERKSGRLVTLHSDAPTASR